MTSRRFRLAESIPGGHPIHPDLARLNTALQHCKRFSEALIELVLRNGAQLRLRVVNVVNVDTFKPQVFQRLFKLVLQIRGCHAMTAAHDVAKAGDAGRDKREITAFGADDEFVASETISLN